jgi:hypothetical protein
VDGKDETMHFEEVVLVLYLLLLLLRSMEGERYVCTFSVSG